MEKDIAQFKVSAGCCCLVHTLCITRPKTQLKAPPDPEMSVVPSCFSTSPLGASSSSITLAGSCPSPLPQATPLGSDAAAGTSGACSIAPSPGTPLFLSTQETLSTRKMRVEANMTEIINDYFETRMPVVEGMGANTLFNSVKT